MFVYNLCYFNLILILISFLFFFFPFCTFSFLVYISFYLLTIFLIKLVLKCFWHYWSNILKHRNGRHVKLEQFKCSTLAVNYWRIYIIWLGQMLFNKYSVINWWECCSYFAPCTKYSLSLWGSTFVFYDNSKNIQSKIELVSPGN